MTFLLASTIWLATTIPFGPVEDSVEAIELNRYYDDNGCEVFQQFIFRDEDGIRDWRMVGKGPHTLDGASLLFFDGGTLRRVRFLERRDSWTQFDPELVEREVLPKESRRLLTTPARRK